MKTRYLYWILLAFVSSPLEPVNAQHKRLEITRTPPISSPGWYDWIYAPGITPAARNELEPLYQQLDVLLRNRLPVAAQEAQDLAWDLLAAAGAEMNSNTPDAVRQSATGRASPKHAATSADSPEAPVSNMLSAILTCERQIKSVRHKHNLDTIIGPANKDVDVSAFFTQIGRASCRERV